MKIVLIIHVHVDDELALSTLDVYNTIVKSREDEVKGKMKVSCVLLHGAPQVGKSSVKRLILNLPPLENHEEESTDLLEDPVRAISTERMTISNQTKKLKELDEGELIRLIKRELHARLKDEKGSEHSSSSNISAIQEKHEDLTVPSDDSENEDVGLEIEEVTSKPLTTSHKNKEETTSPPSEMPEIIAEIAELKIELVDESSPKLFGCQFLHLLDSGGQPQFSDVLPLVFRSESHHHIVVIPLNHKLDETAKNCYRVEGRKRELHNSLLLSHFQMIKRVCQLAKASKSKVIVVGTHLDLENRDEPLTKKNEQMKSLIEEYRNNLVCDTHGNAIFAVNAMEINAKDREKYATLIQKEILTHCVNDRNHEVPIPWILLELELSRRSKTSGSVVKKSDYDEIAKSFQIDNSEKVLDLFNQLALHYHYPAIPGIIFTSVSPITSTISKIVERSFEQDDDTEKWREKGELSQLVFNQMFTSQSQFSDFFSKEDFLSLMCHLRIFFKIENPQEAYFIPSLLPAKEPKINLDDYHSEPLLLFWIDDKYPRVLPQSFFHALIVELLRSGDVILCRTNQYRSAIFLDFNEAHVAESICLLDKVFWLEMSVNKSISKANCRLVCGAIQRCSKSVLKQLGLQLGELQYGLHCLRKNHKSDASHPCLPVPNIKQLKLMCIQEQHRKWEVEEEEEKRIFLLDLIPRQSEFTRSFTI